MNRPRSYDARYVLVFALCIAAGIVLSLALGIAALVHHAAPVPPHHTGEAVAVVHPVADLQHCCTPNLPDQPCEYQLGLNASAGQVCSNQGAFLDIGATDGAGLYVVCGIIEDNDFCARRSLHLDTVAHINNNTLDQYEADVVYDSIVARGVFPDRLRTNAMAYEHTVWLDAAWRLHLYPFGVSFMPSDACFMTLRRTTVYKLASVTTTMA